MSTEVLADEALSAARRRRRRRFDESHEFTSSEMTGEFTDDDDSPMNSFFLDINVCSIYTREHMIGIELEMKMRSTGMGENENFVLKEIPAPSDSCHVYNNLQNLITAALAGYYFSVVWYYLYLYILFLYAF